MVKSKLFIAKVMHKRLTPRANVFLYKVYYLAIILSELSSLASKMLPVNRFGFLSFYEKDHNTTSNSTYKWIESQLEHYGYKQEVKEVMLVTMPRIFGYVFNPVSFWLCIDAENRLRMVVCEVCNTFGEKHNYICLPPQGQTIITKDTWLGAHKVFYVSPFLQRSGEYQFRFHLDKDRLEITINAFTKEGEKILITSLIGEFKEMSKRSLIKVFFLYPFITLKTILLIYFQAVKLRMKRISYRGKPKQQTPTTNY